jgi:hypothetical protein
MSLVICANKDVDGSASRQADSIAEPWSFRNALSSTYKIPANAQVALQSCKINVDGQVVVSHGTNTFYQYFGTLLDNDGSTAPQLEDTIYHPMQVRMLGDDVPVGQVKEFSAPDFANQIASRLNDTIYHPNLKENVTCEVQRNASSLDFLGYTIGFNQCANASNVSGAHATATNHFQTLAVGAGGKVAPIDPDRNGSNTYGYTPGNGKFKREAGLAQRRICSAIFADEPLSLADGIFQVNLSGSHADVNLAGSEVPWVVGLSRFFNNIAGATTQNYQPSYYDPSEPADLGYARGLPYYDFALGRNDAGELVCFQSSFNASKDFSRSNEVQYWNNDNSDFNGSGRVSADTYTDVRFTANGETLKVEVSTNASDWSIVTEYVADEDKTAMFQPIHQACWCLHPVLTIGSTDADRNSEMTLSRLDSPSLTGYDVKQRFGAGWWETMELMGTERLCRDVELRDVINPNVATSYAQQTINASGYFNTLDNVLIMNESDVYSPSHGANAGNLLGFNSTIVSQPSSGAGVFPRLYNSEYAPDVQSSKALFVRLDNFGQNVMNALAKNRSKIISHLPRFDNNQSTGRLYFEPKNFVWIDLDNPAELNVTDFDISFCYSNEQYATILTGQSIVCLYFRSKPKELMS